MKKLPQEVKVSKQQQKILDAMKGKEPMHGTEIARIAGIKIGGIYAVLGRLVLMELVIRKEEYVDFGTTKLRRVTYSLPSNETEKIEGTK